MPARRIPHALVLVFAIVIAAQAAAWWLPAGEFQRNGREVIPGTYALVERTEYVPDTAIRKALWLLPASLLAVPRGLTQAASIVFFVFLVGGVIGVVRRTGAIDAVFGWAARRLGHRPLLLVSGMTVLFALGSATIGMAEEYLPLVPLMVALCLSLGLDAVAAVGIVYVGAGIGYGCSTLNPFTVVIGQHVAGLTPTSGQWLRWVLLATALTLGVHHLIGYARRIHKDPSRSLVHDVDYSTGFERGDVRVRGRHIAVMLAFASTIAVFGWGANLHQWHLQELGALFLGLAVVAAVIARLHVNIIADEFCAGAAQMTGTALIIGFAHAVESVLSDGQVLDTIVHGISLPLERASNWGAAIGMLAVQSVCNVFIPSGSGQAYVTMPIMAPLADITGITRQTAVLAFQMGDGFTNMIVPTNALLMGMLGLGRIPYVRWVAFAGPLLLKLLAFAVGALTIAVAIDYA